MRITSSRKSSLTGSNTHIEAKYDILDTIDQVVLDAIGSTTIDINVETLGIPESRTPSGEEGVELRISSGIYSDTDDSGDINWEWRVKLRPDMSFESESASWSGLEVATHDQLPILKETVRVLEIINNIDWNDIFGS